MPEQCFSGVLARWTADRREETGQSFIPRPGAVEERAAAGRQASAHQPREALRRLLEGTREAACLRVPAQSKPGHLPLRYKMVHS